MKNPVRVRFAPSPTGALHIGGVRTALYNYLFAKKHKGTFILRIEDTDQTRLVPGAEQYIIDALAWLGISFDEGYRIGGDLGPYCQSERKEIYRTYAEELVAAGKAYYAFDTAEELEAMRTQLQAAHVAAPQYNAISRTWMKNSLTLSPTEVKGRIEAGEPYVIRCKLPHKETVRFYDQIRGWIKVETATLDDKVLIKADGMATYHLANIVDDHLMQITHVIRGEEWLPSAPLHVLLYQYFGWEDSMPEFAHLPLLLKPEGHGKLSKRDAEEHGFAVFPIAWQDPVTHIYTAGFREQGYLPEALLNFLAFLGWSAPDGQEIFSKEALVDAFSLDKIGKSGVKFDIQKANWFNQYYLRRRPLQDLVSYLLTPLVEQKLPYTLQQVESVCELIKERAVVLPDLWKEGRIFFEPPNRYDPTVVQQRWSQAAVSFLHSLVPVLEQLPVFDPSAIKQAVADTLQGHGLKLGEVLPAVRLATMGEGSGPDLMQSLALIGQKETIHRIQLAMSALGSGID